MELREVFDRITDILRQDTTKKLSDGLPILLGHDIIINDLDKCCHFSDSNYTRNLIYQNPYLDCYILAWKPGQETAYHQHPTRGCIYKIIKGSLTEIRKNNNKQQQQSTQLMENQCGYIDDNLGCHKMINKHTDNCISLHFYSPSGYYNDK